jgi:hypothetical protein
MLHERRGGPVIESYLPTERYQKDLKKLSADIQEEIKQALKDLKINPRSGRLRLEKLTDYRPAIYTIHVTSNHSHKVSMSINGSTATLRRAGTHKEIDRNP